MRLRSWLVIALAAIAILLLTGRAVTALVVDHAWYVAMGVPGIFWEQLTDAFTIARILSIRSSSKLLASICCSKPDTVTEFA